jgi:hypothetical protein
MWNTLDMLVLFEERKSNILQKLKKSMKGIKFKKRIPTALSTSSFPLIKKSKYKNILIKYNINKKLGAKNGKEDMEIIRKKLIDIKSSAYSRKDKCDRLS